MRTNGHTGAGYRIIPLLFLPLCKDATPPRTKTMVAVTLGEVSFFFFFFLAEKMKQRESGALDGFRVRKQLANGHLCTFYFGSSGFPTIYFVNDRSISLLSFLVLEDLILSIQYFFFFINYRCSSNSYWLFFFFFFKAASIFSSSISTQRCDVTIVSSKFCNSIRG